MGQERVEPAVLNHIGHCVTDLERSQRFYEDVFGFEAVRELKVPDQPADRLLRVEPPLGMTALYLRKDSFILELLHFDRAGNPSPRQRAMNEPGLTHLSFSVDDVRQAVTRAVALGGTVIEETDIGVAVFVRDPDGQLIELMPMTYRSSIG
ncbi:MAG TPA: VOC family protein, partial [Acidimicrobiales bacterium]|nr:VOC family protein [Acidimicrobiales bacterium]